MKEPLNPIPRDLSLDVKHSKGKSGDPDEKALDTSGLRHRSNARASRVDPAYHWLLISSLVLSSILCWLYVTKPVIVQNESSDGVEGLSAGHKKDQSGGVAALIPSQNALPGNGNGPGDGSPQTISPGALAGAGSMTESSPFSAGWESTNLKVQHILSADTGGNELEKIVLDVPVLYETRTMRWTEADIGKARQVMQRLVLYEGKLNELRNEGQAILSQWNELIENTAPINALRADSPSLPCNHGQGARPGDLPESSSVIKVDTQ
jgi:hypothetical protein